MSMKTMSDSGTSNFSKLATVGKGLLLGLGAAAVGVGVAAVEFGDQLENANTQMANAFKNAGSSVSAYQGQITAVDNKLQGYGYTNAQVNAAIARLVGVTGNAQESLNDMGLAADVAKARHMDLNGAVDLIAKTMGGNLTAAKRMGIEIPPEILKIKDPATKANDIMQILENRFKGSAAAAAGTFAGKVAAIKAQGEDLAAQIGTRLIPILETLMTGIMNVVEWFTKHKSAAEALGIALGVVAAGIMAVAIAGFIADAAFPWIPLLIAGIALVAAGIVELATHWQEVWTDIKNWVEDAWVVIKPYWDAIYNYLIGPLVSGVQTMIGVFKQAWTDAQTAMQVAWSIIGPIFNFIKTLGIDYVMTEIQVFQGVWNTAWAAVQLTIRVAGFVIGLVVGAIQTSIGWISSAVNDLVGAWDAAWNAIGGTISAVWNNVLKPVFDAIEAAYNVVKGIVNFFTGSSNAPATATPAQVGTANAQGAHFITGAGFGSHAIGGGGGGASTAPTTLQLVLDNQVIGQVLVPIMQTAFLQAKRSQISLGLS